MAVFAAEWDKALRDPLARAAKGLNDDVGRALWRDTCARFPDAHLLGNEGACGVCDGWEMTDFCARLCCVG